MGYYTKFSFAATLKNVPEETIRDLKAFICDCKYNFINADPSLKIDPEYHRPSTQHEFFKTPKCSALLCGSLEFRNGLYIISILCDLKNGDEVIEQFLDFIEPYIIQRVRRKYLGKSKGENSLEYYYYIQNGKIITTKQYYGKIIL